jgi:hypothetical protein
MMKKRQITKDECALFNKLREQYEGKTLSYMKLLEIFNSNFKNGSRVLLAVKSGNLLTKLSRGKYRFPDKPVYYQVFQKVWDEKPKIKKKEEKTLSDEIEDAILLLSDNGYKVLKKTFDIESEMKSPEQTVSSFIRWEEII